MKATGGEKKEEAPWRPKVEKGRKRFSGGCWRKEERGFMEAEDGEKEQELH
jgi:hypothetical protein